MDILLNYHRHKVFEYLKVYIQNMLSLVFSFRGTVYMIPNICKTVSHCTFLCIITPQGATNDYFLAIILI